MAVFRCLTVPAGIAVLLAFAGGQAAVAQLSRLPAAMTSHEAPVLSESEGFPIVLPRSDLSALAPPTLDTAGGNGAWGCQWLPGSIIYKAYLAGAKESRLSMHLFASDNDGWQFDGTLGGRFGLVRYGNYCDVLPQGVQIDVEASAQVRLDLPEDRDVNATDYRVGVPLTFGFGRHQAKFAYYHLSSHQGDETIMKNIGMPGFFRHNYSRDVLVLGYGLNVTDDLRVYAEAGYGVCADVSEEWEFQFGIDYAPAYPTGIRGAPFCAINGHLREEVDFGGNVTFQLGWAWRADRGGRLLRLGVHYYNGEGNQFSFFDNYEDQIGIGLWYDF